MAGTGSPKTRLQIEFGVRVRDRRHERAWSQERLALEAGINRTYIGSLEAGERNPALATVARLARALDIDLGALLAGLQTFDHR